MSMRLIHFFLALSLLMMQWAGVSHRIAHAPITAYALVVQAVTGDAAESHDHHDHEAGSSACALLDGCALADTLCSAPLVTIDVPTGAQARVAHRDQFRSTSSLSANARAPPSSV